MSCMRFQSAAFRVIGLLAASCFSLESVQAQRGGRSGVVEVPSCPEYLLGQIDGCYYYVTSDCKGQTGYGQSPDLIPLPQCSEGVCGRKVSTPGGSPEGPDSVPQSELDAWKAAITERLSQLDKELSLRGQSDSRRSRLLQLKTRGSSVLRQLDSPLLSAEEKFKANSSFNQSIGDYFRANERIGLAGGFSGPSLTIEDRPMRQVDVPNDQPVVRMGAANGAALRNSSEVNFDTSKAGEHNKNARALGYQVQAEKRDVLKVPVGGGKFAYFQTFALNVSNPSGNAGSTLYVGIQVNETPTAKTASFSERGSFAHRIRSEQGTPFLVNSVEMLNALPRE